MSKDAKLVSRLLFEARERVEMSADVVEIQSGKTDTWGRRLIAEIDTYRTSQGWSPYGFGDEEENET